MIRQVRAPNKTFDEILLVIAGLIVLFATIYVLFH